jgi:anti-sigma B factor antagonist
MSWGLDVETSAGDEQVTVAVAGDVDELHVGDLSIELARATASGASLVVVDLSAVTFLSSAGVRCLIVANQAARTAGVGFRVGRPSQVVRRVMELTGIGQVLNVED